MSKKDEPRFDSQHSLIRSSINVSLNSAPDRTPPCFKPRKSLKSTDKKDPSLILLANLS
jgi:hypothetical protein